jgi:hypothetical protein
MTIEEALARSALNLGRIADALEALVNSQGIVPGTKVTLTIKDDVRPVLKRLREDKSHAAVKSLLKTYGASTLQQLEEKNFANVIADALEQLGEEVQDELDLDDDL